MSLQSALDGVKTHFDANLVINPVDFRTNKWIRDFAKWWFDLIKNMILVTALRVLSDRAESWLVTGIYLLSTFMLLTYVLTYFMGWYYVPFRNHPNKFISGFVSLGIGVLISWGAIQTISVAEALIIERIVHAQAH
jgi:hypothetical protein